MSEPKADTSPTEEGEAFFRKNHSTPCMGCGGLPTVGDEEMCGPCFFGEADTAGGNW